MGELVPQPGVDPRFDAARHGHEAIPTSMGPVVLVRLAAEILLLNRELLAALVVELGGDWNTTTVNELTVVPSEDVESCIRGLHINGALEPPTATWHPGTGVAVAHDCCWRGTTSPWSSYFLSLHLRLALLHRLSLWALVQKQDGARERPATPDGKKKKRAQGHGCQRGRSTGHPQSRRNSRPRIGSRLGDDLTNARGAKWVKTATTTHQASHRLEVREEGGFRWIGRRR